MSLSTNVVVGMRCIRGPTKTTAFLAVMVVTSLASSSGLLAQPFIFYSLLAFEIGSLLPALCPDSSCVTLGCYAHRSLIRREAATDSWVPSVAFLYFAHVGFIAHTLAYPNRILPWLTVE